MSNKKSLINRELNLNRLKSFDEILETYRNSIYSKIDKNLDKIKSINKDYNSKEAIEYQLRYDYEPELVVEDNSYVPRFSVKQHRHPLFIKYPPNKEMKFSPDLISTAIKYGMIMMIQYRGAKDKFVQGHQRVIYPMVYGFSAKRKPLLRAYHLRGWSVSGGGNLDKEWRLFRTDRILSISFTGSFFRLPPDGYNMNDKGMVGGINTAANFDNIRKNQKQLVQKNVIQNKQETEIGTSKKLDTIQLEPTKSVINLQKPFDNPNLSKNNKDIIRMSFLKAVGKEQYIAVLGALGKRGNKVKVTSRGKYLGQFIVLKATMGTNLGKPHIRKINGQSEFNLFLFTKKL